MHTDLRSTATAALAQRLAQLVPAHAHVVIREPSDGESSWTWTTRAGVWAIYAGPRRGVCGTDGIMVSGPGGSWTLPADTETAAPQLQGILRALGGICGMTHVEHTAAWRSWRGDCQVCGFAMLDPQQCAAGHPDDGVASCGACGYTRSQPLAT